MAATERRGEVIVKHTHMETGKWYPENEGEKARETVHTILLCIVCFALYAFIGKVLLIG